MPRGSLALKACAGSRRLNPQQTLEQEYNADKHLTKLAESGLNRQAA